ncbi:hypothetical protein M8994_19390 [Brucella sp. 21LCYQ03]|nr:hypothetical protein [Brucella sp. 21LCYQ03]
MLLRRTTIVCMMIAGFAIVAGLFVDRKQHVYRDQPITGDVTVMHLGSNHAKAHI